MPEIAFIGAGRMAGAMARGMIARGGFSPAELSCIGGPADTTGQDLSATTGIRLAASAGDLLQRADVIVLAFKPQHLSTAGAGLDTLTRGKLIVSILAGRRTDRLARSFPNARNIVRAMPNTPGQIGAGITGWCSRAPLPQADTVLVERILGSLGKVVHTEESHLDAITAVGGSGPGFAFEFIAALRDGGVAAGLDPETSTRFALEATLGAARLMSETGGDPDALRNQVTSPHGTTYEGLQEMAAGNFRGIIRQTILAAARRSAELAAED